MEKYTAPELEIDVFETDDILTVSGRKEWDPDELPETDLGF